MTGDDIICMAQEAGFEQRPVVGWGFEYGRLGQSLERFAKLVAAAEREACAKLCEEDGLLWGKKYAEAIRARGEQPKRHPGYIIGDHWLQAAYTRVCTGEDVRDVMADYGWYP